MPAIVLQNSKNGLLRFFRERSNQATIADRCVLKRATEVAGEFIQHGPRLVRSMATKILVKRFDEQTAAARASTFVALVLGDVHLEMTLRYEVLDFKARKQIEEAIQASLR